MKKRFIALTSLCLAACCVFGSCGTGGDDKGNDLPENETTRFVNFDYSDDTDMGETVNLANSLANGVQAYYTSADKEAYTFENRNVTLTHNLTRGNAKYVADLSSRNGGTYLFNTMDTFIESAGDVSYASDSGYAAFANTAKLGYYYYEVNVRDLMFNESLYAEKTYHVYSDRIYQQFRMLAATSVRNLDAFGFEAKFRGDTVEKIEIYDGAVRYSSTENEYDKTKVQYVAFVIKDVGTIAFIASTEGCSLSVTKNAKGNYLFTQTYPLTGVSVAGGEDVVFGNRLYTDETGDFAGVRKANAEERAPLTEANVTVDESVDKAKFLGYNGLNGRYEFYIDGSDFPTAYKNPYKQYKEKITVKNCPADRDVYFYVHSEYPLEGACIMDGNEQLLPMGVEVCKNFNHEKEEPVYDPDDPMYGDTVFPFRAEKDKDVTFTVLNVYQNWGNYRIKQLSSIAYYISYYHLSTGIRETNCIAPYFSARSNRRGFSKAWILPDFRGASCDPKTQADSSRDQRDSVGSLCGVTNGADLGNYVSSYIRSSGLTYADLDYSYVSADGSYKYTYRHVEMPQLDEARTYYTVNIEFLRDVSISPEKFGIIGFDGRNAVYSNAAYLNENGQHVVLDDLAAGADGAAGASALYKLHAENSYFTYYNIASSPAENGNFGLIVKDYEITVNGQKSNLGLALYDSARDGLNWGALTIAQKTDFKKGDTITADVTLLPYGARSGQTNCDSVLNVYRDTATNPVKLTAEKGAAVNDKWIPTVQALGNTAEFTLSGGTSDNGEDVTYTVKATGFTKLGKPVLREKVNGTWRDVEISSACGYDGYSVYYENGKITYSFVVSKGAADKTIKISIV